MVTTDDDRELAQKLADELGELMLFNVNSILMEVARREDEWTRFRHEIPIPGTARLR